MKYTIVTAVTNNAECPGVHLLELHVQVHVVILPRLLRQVVGPPVLAKDRSITSIFKPIS